MSLQPFLIRRVDIPNDPELPEGSRLSTLLLPAWARSEDFEMSGSRANLDLRKIVHVCPIPGGNVDI